MERAARMLLWVLLLLDLHVLCHMTDDHDKNDHCFVMEEKHLNTNSSTRTLAFITSQHNLEIVVSYQDFDNLYYRDALYLSNYEVSQYKVRNGKSSKNGHQLPVVIGEGWNMLRLLVNDRNFNLEWITETDERTLLTLTLDFTAHMISLGGSFAVCSGASPEWQVGVGQRVTVLLNPLTSEQELILTGEDNTRASLMNINTPVSVPSNTTLTVKSRQRGLISYIDIKQEKEELVQMVQPIRPVMVVESNGGSTNLRLTLPGTQKKEENSCCQNIKEPAMFISTFIIIYLFTSTLMGVIIVVLGYLLWKQKRNPLHKRDDGENQLCLNHEVNHNGKIYSNTKQLTAGNRTENIDPPLPSNAEMLSLLQKKINIQDEMDRQSNFLGQQQTSNKLAQHMQYMSQTSHVVQC